MDRGKSGSDAKSPAMEMGIKLKNLLNYFNRASPIKTALLIAAIGAGILLLPQNSKTAQAFSEEAAAAVEISAATAEERMEEILSKVDGAGSVAVMLVTEDNGTIEYQTDVEESREGEQSQLRTQTVFSGSAEGALIKTRTEPKYRGAVVVCSGADSAQVRLHLSQAVCSLTGLSSNKVTILKMEQN